MVWSLLPKAATQSAQETLPPWERGLVQQQPPAQPQVIYVTRDDPRLAQQEQGQRSANPTEGKTSVVSKALSTTYKAVKYTVNFPLVSFPKNGDIKSLALGTAMVAGIGSAVILQGIPLASGLGVAAGAVSFLLVVNIIRGLAIPLLVTTAGAAALSYKDPKLAQKLGGRVFKSIQTQVNRLLGQVISKAPTVAQDAAAKALEAQKAANFAKAAAEKAQAIADAAKTVEAKAAAQAAMKAAEEAGAKAEATQAAADAIKAAETAGAAGSQKGILYSIYSKMALGLGIGMHFAGTGASLVGEGKMEAGLEALKGSHTEERMSQIRLAVKLTPVALGAIAGSVIATSTGLGLIYIALPSITFAATRTLSWYSESSELNDAVKNVKLSNLTLLQLNSDEAEEIEETDAKTTEYDLAKAQALIVQGIALDTLGSTSSMLGLGLVQAHGGFLWTVGSSLLGRITMIKAVSDWQTEGNASLFETFGSFGSRAFTSLKGGVQRLHQKYQERQERIAEEAARIEAEAERLQAEAQQFQEEEAARLEAAHAERIERIKAKRQARIEAKAEAKRRTGEKHTLATDATSYAF